MTSRSSFTDRGSSPGGVRRASRAQVLVTVFGLGLTSLGCRSDRTAAEAASTAATPNGGTGPAFTSAPAPGPATSGAATPVSTAPALNSQTTVTPPSPSLDKSTPPQHSTTAPSQVSTLGAGKPGGAPVDKSKPGPTVATTSAPPAPRPTTVLVSGVVSGEGYRTSLQMPSPIVVGQSAEAVVNLTPQSPFKSNEKYPYRFSFGEVAGVTTPASAVTGATVTPEKTTLRFAVTGKSVGRGSIAGTFSFSVCTAEKCLVERAPLVLSFEVVADAVSAGRNP